MIVSFNRRLLARMLALTAVAALLGGLAADCSGEGGTYQGPGDSVPYHRR